MGRTKYLVIITLLTAAVIIAAAAPKGPSVLEITASLNAIGETKGNLDTYVALSSQSSFGLDRMGRRTIIAPNDAAFDEYFAAQGTTLDAVLSDQNEVDRLVGSHLIRGYRSSSQLVQANTLRTNEGTAINVENGVFTYEGSSAKIVRPDAYAANGVVHVIDGVLA